MTPEQEKFNEMMWLGYLFEIDKMISVIREGGFDIHINDEQLMRELSCGRFLTSDTYKIINELGDCPYKCDYSYCKKTSYKYPHVDIIG